jgi:hypothetical protein
VAGIQDTGGYTASSATPDRPDASSPSYYSSSTSSMAVTVLPKECSGQCRVWFPEGSLGFIAEYQANLPAGDEVGRDGVLEEVYEGLIFQQYAWQSERQE